MRNMRFIALQKRMLDYGIFLIEGQIIYKTSNYLMFP